MTKQPAPTRLNTGRNICTRVPHSYALDYTDTVRLNYRMVMLPLTEPYSVTSYLSQMLNHQ